MWQRPDASMTLLREVTDHPLDPAYEEAARRREISGAPHRTWLTQAVVFLLAVALGLGLVAATQVLRAPQSVRNQARDVLIEQITDRQTRQTELMAANADLSQQVRDLTAEQLTASDPAMTEQLQRLALASGVEAVSGPAYVVTLSDSAQAQEDPTTYPEELVQALDLQVVVNALWQAGAEAVGVNGVRVSASGAIRGAGSALFVDLVPVSSSYEVVAIGPVDAMRSAMARSSASTHLALLRDRYHIGVGTGTRQEEWLPGVRTTQPRFATVVPDPADDTGDTGQTGQTGTSGGTPTTEGGAQ